MATKKRKTTFVVRDEGKFTVKWSGGSIIIDGEDDGSGISAPAAELLRQVAEALSAVADQFDTRQSKPPSKRPSMTPEVKPEDLLSSSKPRFLNWTFHEPDEPPASKRNRPRR